MTGSHEQNKTSLQLLLDWWSFCSPICLAAFAWIFLKSFILYNSEIILLILSAVRSSISTSDPFPLAAHHRLPLPCLRWSNQIRPWAVPFVNLGFRVYFFTLKMATLTCIDTFWTSSWGNKGTGHPAAKKLLWPLWATQTEGLVICNSYNHTFAKPCELNLECFISTSFTPVWWRPEAKKPNNKYTNLTVYHKVKCLSLW